MTKCRKYDELIILVGEQQTDCATKKAIALSRKLPTGDKNRLFTHAPATVLFVGSQDKLKSLQRECGAKINIVDFHLFKAKANCEYRITYPESLGLEFTFNLRTKLEMGRVFVSPYNAATGELVG